MHDFWKGKLVKKSIQKGEGAIKFGRSKANEEMIGGSFIWWRYEFAESNSLVSDINVLAECLNVLAQTISYFSVTSRVSVECTTSVDEPSIVSMCSTWKETITKWADEEFV